MAKVKPENWITEAIARCGGITLAAATARVSANTLYAWEKQRFITLALPAHWLAQATSIRFLDLVTPPTDQTGDGTAERRLRRRKTVPAKVATLASARESAPLACAMGWT